VRDADVGDLARTRVGDVPSADGDLPGVQRAQADDRFDELRLPVALHAGDRDDLARANLQVKALDRHLQAVVTDEEVAQLEHHVAGLRRALGDDQLHVAPDHQVRQLLARRGLGVRGARHAAPAQDDDLVGDLDHLVELVGDEDDRRPGRRERADDAEQLLGLVRRQDGARLVEDEDVALAVQGLEDLHALPHADGETLDLRVRVDLELVLLRQLHDALARRGPIERSQGPAHRLRAERDRLDHVEDRDEHEVLVDHADTGSDRRGRVPERMGLAVDEDLAGVRLVQAGQDVHERRLAGAVLPEEAEHLALVHRDGDLVVGEDAREPLRNLAQLEPHHVGPRLTGLASTG
jgi:hypothetical protein